EVTKTYQDKVPPHYIRKQTLANCERYITDELKQLEDTILSAGERIALLEYELFEQILEKIESNLPRIQATIHAIAVTDCLCSLAEVAVENHYCMPEINLSDKIVIQDGRHPVVEQMQKNNLFVPNDTLLDRQDNRLAMITGPNMAGKSTYMRQVALITLMAQIGSFVPASFAQIGVVDKIFTRVGASDDISSGRSTFMVEMSEVAYILQHATPKSLLILDEIGRGTSTFDGLSIAWAVIEHVVDPKLLGAKTLFATHYHELTELEHQLSGVKNYCIAVKKRGDDVVFLRKIIRGGADDSFGIEVAKLAGVPSTVLKRAKKILRSLEAGKQEGEGKKLPRIADQEPEGQLDLLTLGGSQVLEELKRLDISTMSPIEAMNCLYQMQQKLQG
ncbi:MAG: DNA mismatch repair protein MutS, partial [Clostridia bacterium]|nr:DNA mismatch repair protein MutS [Clostridia bacterium]